MVVDEGGCGVAKFEKDIFVRFPVFILISGFENTLSMCNIVFLGEIKQVDGNMEAFEE